jgi:hypothetical protein
MFAYENKLYHVERLGDGSRPPDFQQPQYHNKDKTKVADRTTKLNTHTVPPRNYMKSSLYDTTQLPSHVYSNQQFKLSLRISKDCWDAPITTYHLIFKMYIVNGCVDDHNVP